MNRKNVCFTENTFTDSPNTIAYQKVFIKNEPTESNQKECDFCGKKLSSSSNYHKHLRICKEKNKKEKEEIYQELIKRLNHQNKKISILEQQHNELIKELVNIKNSKSINNTIKNITNNMQINNNIKLVPFGKEDLSYLSPNICKKILSKGFSCVPHLISHVHFNSNKPEHSNVYISNMRDTHIMIYDGKKWTLQPRDDTILQLYDEKKEFLIDKFEVLVDELNESSIKKFKRFLDNHEDDDVVNSIKKEIKLILYNNRKLPINIRKMFETDETKCIE
jgi:hypothetical protein